MMFPTQHRAVLIRLPHPAKNIPSEPIAFQGGSVFAYCKANSAVDCLAALAAPLAVPAAAPLGFSRFRGPGPVAGSPPAAFVRGFSSSCPSAVLGSAWLPQV